MIKDFWCCSRHPGWPICLIDTALHELRLHVTFICCMLVGMFALMNDS